MMTKANISTDAVDHATNLLCHRQVCHRHFIPIAFDPDSLADHSGRVSHLIKRDNCDDFTKQFLLNQAVRSSRS